MAQPDGIGTSCLCRANSNGIVSFIAALFVEKVALGRGKTLAKPDWEREVRDLYGVRGVGCPLSKKEVIKNDDFST